METSTVAGEAVPTAPGKWEGLCVSPRCVCWSPGPRFSGPFGDVVFTEVMEGEWRHGGRGGGVLIP